MTDVGAEVGDESGGKVAAEGMTCDGKSRTERAIPQPRLHLGLERLLLWVKLGWRAIEDEVVGNKVGQPLGAANGEVFRPARYGLKNGGGYAGDGVGVLVDDVPFCGKGGGLRV